MQTILAQYDAYVATVVANQLGPTGLREDVEELTANVFLSLWTHRDRLKTSHLRGWLGAAGRNEARMFLRRQREPLIPEEDVLLVDDEDAQRLLERRERTRIVGIALDALGEPDREVFLRHYYYNQTVAEIAEEMSLHPEAVKSKLRRGRKKLKEILKNGGYVHDA